MGEGVVIMKKDLLFMLKTVIIVLPIVLLLSVLSLAFDYQRQIIRLRSENRDLKYHNNVLLNVVGEKLDIR